MSTDSKIDNMARKAKDVDVKRGLNENWETYDACQYRESNAGLFTADQNLKKNNKGTFILIYYFFIE